ncbi:MAG: DegV family EDD domain-containing protein [Candidatus Aminicenantes bacterium]|nr:DegV family EDD domain-containing protein [Candidatus Aminicenantes bacterium]MDH5384342.1 DegV family EDD domain-containing protein [Candidatus Aminicenantes bacterium]
MKRPHSVQIGYLDGHRYQYAVVAGCKEIVKHEKELNRLNVFPIPDRDTGSNLKKTLIPIVNTYPLWRPEINLASQKIADLAAQFALGYSGIIFAEILFGLAEGLKNYSRIRTQDLGSITSSAVNRAYRSLKQPVEGTILSVLREWSEEVNELCSSTNDFVFLLEKSYQRALSALQNTPNQLDILRKNKVVDAGGKAFVRFLEGILGYIEKGKLKTISSHTRPTIDTTSEEKRKAPFCAECCVKADHLDRRGLIKKLNELGRGMIFYGASQFVKIHINTENPEDVFSLVSQFGKVSSKKVYEFSDGPKAQAKESICLVSDSTCDLADELIENNPVYFVPIKVHAEDKIYTDRWDIIPEEFYNILDSSTVLPKTSQPSLMDFTQIFSHLLAHYQSIVSVQISKELSGTYQTAVQASESLALDRISVLDGNNLSVGLGLVLLEGIKAVDQGKDLEEVLNRIQRAIKDIKIYIGLPTLKYLVKGGRITRTKGFIAGILNINPVLSLNPQGKFVSIDKARGKKRLKQKIMNFVIDRIQRRTVEFSVAVAHTNAPEIGRRLALTIQNLIGQKVEMVMNASPALGAHAGPGAFGVAVLTRVDESSSQSDKTLKT